MRAIYVILAWPGECSYKAKPNTTCTGSELRLELDIYLTSPLLTRISAHESLVYSCSSWQDPSDHYPAATIEGQQQHVRIR